MDTKQQYQIAWRMCRLFEYKRLAPKDEKLELEHIVAESYEEYRQVKAKADIAAHTSFRLQDKPIESFVRHDWKPDLLAYQQGRKMPRGYVGLMSYALYNR